MFHVLVYQTPRMKRPVMNMPPAKLNVEKEGIIFDKRGWG